MKKNRLTALRVKCSHFYEQLIKTDKPLSCKINCPFDKLSYKKWFIIIK